MLFGTTLNVYAAPKTMPDGQTFDAEFYAKNNPDVVAALGKDEAALYNHYVTYGKIEGRKPYADAQTGKNQATVDVNYWTDYEDLGNGQLLQHPLQWEVLTPGGEVTDAMVIEMAKDCAPTGTEWGKETAYDLQGYKKGNGVAKRGYACGAFAYWLTDALFGTTPAYIINSADDSGSITIKTYDIVCYGEHAVVVLGITGTGADTVLTVAEGGYNGKTVNWGRTVSVVNEVIPVGNFAIIRREGM